MTRFHKSHKRRSKNDTRKKNPKKKYTRVIKKRGCRGTRKHIRGGMVPANPMMLAAGLTAAGIAGGLAVYGPKYIKLVNNRRRNLTTLGLKRGATNAQIKKTFRTLSRKNHPDRGGDPEEFKRISNAYEALIPKGPRDLEGGGPWQSRVPRVSGI